MAVIHLRDLRRQYYPQAPPGAHEGTLLIVASAVCIVLGPAFASGITPTVPATAAALILAGTLLVRNRPLLRAVKVPWLVVLAVSGLFVVVDLALAHGLRDLLAGWVGTGTGTGTADLLRVSAVGAGTANAVDNLTPPFAPANQRETDPPIPESAQIDPRSAR